MASRKQARSIRSRPPRSPSGIGPSWRLNKPEGAKLSILKWRRKSANGSKRNLKMGLSSHKELFEKRPRKFPALKVSRPARDGLRSFSKGGLNFSNFIQKIETTVITWNLAKTKEAVSKGKPGSRVAKLAKKTLRVLLSRKKKTASPKAAPVKNKLNLRKNSDVFISLCCPKIYFYWSILILYDYS